MRRFLTWLAGNASDTTHAEMTSAARPERWTDDDYSSAALRYVFPDRPDTNDSYPNQFAVDNWPSNRARMVARIESLTNARLKRHCEKWLKFYDARVESSRRLLTPEGVAMRFARDEQRRRDYDARQQRPSDLLKSLGVDE